MLGLVSNYAFYQMGASRSHEAARATPTPASASPGRPIYGINQVLEFSPTQIKFGEIKASELAERTVTVVNKGSETVQVEEVNPSCSCTIPSLDPMTLEPGQTATMIVMLNPALAQDFFNVSVSVSYKGRPEVDTLQLSGRLSRP